MNSKRKGIRGELEVVHALRAIGLRARRAQQYQGLASDGDVVIDGAPEVHAEVKFRAQLGVYPYLEQATRDCRGRKAEAVFAKANRKRLLFICYLDRLPFIARALQEAGLGSTITEAEESQSTSPEPAGDRS